MPLFVVVRASHLITLYIYSMVLISEAHISLFLCLKGKDRIKRSLLFGIRGISVNIKRCIKGLCKTCPENTTCDGYNKYHTKIIIDYKLDNWNDVIYQNRKNNNPVIKTGS